MVKALWIRGKRRILSSRKLDTDPMGSYECQMREPPSSFIIQDFGSRRCHPNSTYGSKWWTMLDPLEQFKLFASSY